MPKFVSARARGLIAKAAISVGASLIEFALRLAPEYAEHYRNKHGWVTR